MINRGTPRAKAGTWDGLPRTPVVRGFDAEARKRGERNGLDTRVVHAVNDEG